MTIKLNVPSPSSVQFKPPSEQSYRLFTGDGRLFTQVSVIEGETAFPAAFSAHVAGGNTRLNMSDIPASLHDELSNALQAAGWFTRTEWFANLDMVSVAALPYTTVAYGTVPHLCWSKEPFPLMWEEKLWLWIKSWFI